MPETIHIGSREGALLAAAFFAAMSAAIGYVLFALLARPETRRAEFLSFGAASRRFSAIFATVFSSALYALICWSLFSGFHRIDVDGDWLRLHYYYPPRVESVRRDELTLLEKRLAHKVSWRLGITTRSGLFFESRTAGIVAIEQARVRLAQLAAE